MKEEKRPNGPSRARLRAPWWDEEVIRVNTADEDDRGEPLEGSAAEEHLIVVGVDGSKASSAALWWAAEEARLRGARLKVVHAWHMPTFVYGAYMIPPEELEGFRSEAEALLDRQLAQVLGEHTELSVLRELKEGPAAKAIIEASKDAELVVVGSRGRGGFSGLLLGSVSGHVAQHAHCPVTIVRGVNPD
jgi:nucleotide-binding universal stress UspA family protein